MVTPVAKPPKQTLPKDDSALKLAFAQRIHSAARLIITSNIQHLRFRQPRIGMGAAHEIQSRPVRDQVLRWAAQAVVAGFPLFSANAIAEQIFHDAGSWLQVVGEGSLTFLHPDLGNFRLWLEGQARFDDNWQRWYQGVARAALGYSLSDRATIWVGYSWVPTQPAGPSSYISQQDVFPAFRYIAPTTLGTFTFRTMVDTNFLRGDQPRVRPRQLIRFLRPIGFEQRLSLVVWDEVFVRVNSTPWGGTSGFDQNRAFIGLGWSFSPDVRTEVGYMNQYVDDARHLDKTMRHLIMGSLFFSF